MTQLTPRAEQRAKARQKRDLTIEDVARLLPGKRWGLMTKAQRMNRIAYIARIERHGTSCEKLARRLGGIYGLGCFVFLPEVPPTGRKLTGQTRKPQGNSR